MFASVKSRLAAVASPVWIAGAALVSDYDFDRYVVTLFAGWVIILVLIYGTFWIIDAPRGGISISMPKIPKWLAYVLIGIMLFVIMGLPKALSVLMR